MYAKDFYQKFQDEFLYLREENEVLPDPLTCETPNTMEYDTLVRRIPEDILGRVLKAEETFFPRSGRETQLKKLEELFKNGEKKTYEKLELQKEEEDKKYWDFFLEYFMNKQLPIIKNPWLFSELYFYRYLDMIYKSQNKQIDPYAESKSVAVIKNIDVIEEMCTCANNLMELAKDKNKQDKKIFSIFFFISLWGNLFDFSFLPPKNGSDKNKQNERETTKKEEEIIEQIKESEIKRINDIRKGTLQQKKFSFQTENIDKLYNSFYIDNILCNDIDELFEMVTATQKHNRLDIILDNAGVELIADLCLLSFMSLYFEQIVIHVKKLPIFVSDVIMVDFNETIEYLSNQKRFNCWKLGSLCKALLNSKRWVVKESLYWCLPLPFWVPLKDIYNDMCASNLICIKGDLNYRRSIGDLKFDFSHPFSEVVNYFPSPVVLLRCLKSPLGCGIDKKIVEEVKSKDSNWCNFGKYAVLQYHCGKN